MRRRADTYAALLREHAARQPWGKRPNRVLVVPVVVYNGPKRWLATQTSAPAWTGEQSERVVSYHLVDVGPHGRYDPEWRGPAAAQSHFERARTPEAFVEIFSKLVEDLPKPGDDALKRAFYRWVLRLLQHRGLPVEPLYNVEDLTEGLPMIVETMKQWERGWRQKQLLVRLAGTKFVPKVVSRLEAVLEGIADPGRMEAVSDLVLKCETGEEFLASVGVAS